MKVYVTDHDINKKVSKAFAEGCNGQIVPARTLLPGPATFYGILRGCGDLIKQCEWLGRNYYHIDLGYFRRGHFEGYYRVSKNGFQYDFEEQREFPSDRWEKLKLQIKPWKTDGREIVICPPTVTFGRFLDIDTRKWTESVLVEAARHTERPVLVSTKDSPANLKDAYCLITHQSNVAVDALINGVPVLALGDSACWPMSWDWRHLESPYYRDGREEWAHALAYQQFTLEEFETGEAWKLLNAA